MDCNVKNDILSNKDREMIGKNETEIMENWTYTEPPLLSVTCITYNHEPYITEALDGILMQKTDFPFEVIVHDDCSTDKTVDILVKYAEKYPTIIKLILQKENQWSQGIKPAMATMKKSSGKYIAICEGDDYWTDSKKLQIQIDLMEQNPECYLSFHPADELINDKLTGKVWSNHGVKNKVFTDIEMIRGIGNVFCPTASMIFNRQVLDPVPDFFYTVPAADNFTQYLGSLNGGALFIARNMSIYRRENPGSWSTVMKKKDNMNAVENRKNYVFRYIKSLDDMGNFIDQKYRKEVDKKISSSLFSLSLIYLNNNFDKDFRKMLVRSHEVHKPTGLLHSILYHFRLSPFLARKVVKLHDNPQVRKIFSNLRKAIK